MNLPLERDLNLTLVKFNWTKVDNLEFRDILGKQLHQTLQNICTEEGLGCCVSSLENDRAGLHLERHIQ